MTPRDPQPGWLHDATRWPVVRRALIYAVVVGTILVSINHGDAILSGHVTSDRMLRIGLTVIVPYLVSTFSAVSAMRQMRQAPDGRHV